MPSIHFKGKPVVKNYHYAVPFHTVEIDRKKSLGRRPELNDNLIIQGDNLVALKALIPTHAGKIKCVYADPPYNTGKEGWCYNDAVNSPLMRKWLKQEVSAEDLERHDKWCCMIYPRMQLLRELLCDDGVIFVSIDDNEVAHLRMIMDEIFGEENFVRVLVWNKKEKASGVPTKNMIIPNFEYILVYRKENEITFQGQPRSRKSYKKDKYGRYWRKMPIQATGDQDNYYKIIEPESQREFYGNWAFSEERVKELIFQKRIKFPKKNDGKPVRIVYEDELKNKLSAIFSNIGHFDSESSTKELNKILAKNKFDFPKPMDLIEFLLEQVTQPGDLILDSFAGSGTTAHATLALNAKEVAEKEAAKQSLDFEQNGDKPAGGRRFILVECEDYANSITAERVRRVIRGVQKSSDPLLKKGLKDTFTFCTLSKEPLSADRLLEAESLPEYLELARYVFYSAIGRSLDEKKVIQDEFYLGNDGSRAVYLLYQADREALKSLVLDMDWAQRICRKHRKMEKLVYAPQTFLEEWDLREKNISFVCLPFIPGL